MTPLDLLGLCGVSVLWGSQYLLINKALVYMQPDDLAIAVQAVSIPLLIVTILAQQAWNNFNTYRQLPTQSQAEEASDSDEVASQKPESVVSRKSSQSISSETASTWQQWKGTLFGLLIVGIITQGLGHYTCNVAGEGFSSGVLGIMFCLEPVVAAASAALLKVPGSRLNLIGFIGMAVSAGGIGMVVYPNLVSENSGINEPGVSVGRKVLYILMGILSPTLYGFGGIVCKLVMEKHPVPLLLSVMIQMVFGMIYIFLQSCVVNAASGIYALQALVNLVNAPATVWLYCLGMSLSSSLICWALFLWLLQRIGAQASLYAFLVPCVALALGAVFNNEWKGVPGFMIAIQLVGVVIVLLGMGLVMMDELREMVANARDGKIGLNGVKTYKSISAMSVHSVEPSHHQQSHRRRSSTGSQGHYIIPQFMIGTSFESLPLIKEDSNSHYGARN